MNRTAVATEGAAFPPGPTLTDFGIPSSPAFATPPDWQVVPIGHLARVTRGASPRPIDNPAWFDVESGTGWLRIADVTAAGKYLLTTKQDLSTAGIAHSRFVSSGNLVMSICATVGRPIITAKDVCIHDGFVVFGNLKAEIEYVYYVLSAMGTTWSDRGQTGSQMNLNTDIIKSATVRLPPSDEQRAISKALSAVDGLLQGLEALIVKKRGVKRAAMQQLLTGKTRLPGFSDHWATRRLRTICTFLPTASNPRGDLDDHGDVEYIHYGDVHAHARPVLDCTNRSLPRIAARHVGGVTQLRDGDLVMVDASEDLNGVGKSVEVQGIADTPVVAGLHTILCRGDDRVWAGGFKAYLQFIPAFRSALARVAAGTSVYAISTKQLAAVELRLPARSEQAAIVGVLSEMDAEITAIERRLEKTRAVKQGMMQQLLTGRVRLVEPAATAVP